MREAAARRPFYAAIIGMLGVARRDLGLGV